MPREPRRAVFLTYTFAHPFAVGVFFRALRLSFELRRRGWEAIVCNGGPLPEDPKIREAEKCIEIRSVEPPVPGDERAYAFELFRGLKPDLMVFGEEPFPGMEPFYEAARMMWAPFVVLDQFYEDYVAARRYGVDRLLLYGIRSLWPERPRDRPGFFSIIPPFIEKVTPRARLPLPEGLADLPLVTVLGFDERVLNGGLELLASLEEPRASTVTVSPDPVASERRMAHAGIPAERRLALPLQCDADLFGLIAASRAVILANGFMQVMEALALGCPAIAVHRGIGMDSWSLDDTFVPFVAMDQSLEEQRARLASWLRQSPFSEAQLADLATERDGARVAVDQLEAIARRPRPWRRLQRLGARLRWQLGGRQRSVEPARPSGLRPLYEFDDQPEPGAVAKVTESEPVG